MLIYKGRFEHTKTDEIIEKDCQCATYNHENAVFWHMYIMEKKK